MSLCNLITISNLHPNANNFIVSGLVINKSNSRTFERHGQSKKSAVINFVIRDSKHYYINVNIWGSTDFIENYNLQFTIGHVVDIIKSNVSPVLVTDNFRPFTPIALKLTINEGYGSMDFYKGDIEKYLKLLSVPLKSPDLALTLADIACVRSTSDSDCRADLLVVVAKLKPVRQIKNIYSVRDVIVMDETFPGMCLTLWNEAWIDRSDSWNEMSTVLHLINVSYKYSEFHKSIVLSTILRTLIIANPESEKASALLEYAKNAPINSIYSDLTIDLSSITTVMTIQQITDKIEGGSDDMLYCVTYAMVTFMDLDGQTQFYSRRCSHCQSQIRVKDESCNNENCSILYAENPYASHYIDYFNIPVHLTDHTGTLEQCRLLGDTAERILGYTLLSFLALSCDERGSIKWKFLLERCCVKLSIKRKTALRWYTLVSIVDCKVADPAEVLERIKPY